MKRFLFKSQNKEKRRKLDQQSKSGYKKDFETTKRKIK